MTDWLYGPTDDNQSNLDSLLFCAIKSHCGEQHWLDASMRISRQLKQGHDVHSLYFGVKFYAADPCKLIEEITRYQLFLQVKQDVLQGRLPVSFELATELGAFVVQCEYNMVARLEWLILTEFVPC